MCFAMREGIIDQQSDVCGDVNERTKTRHPADPPFSFFHRSLFSRKPTSVPYISVPHQPIQLTSSFSLSLFSCCCLFEIHLTSTLLFIRAYPLHSSSCKFTCSCVCVQCSVYIIGISFTRVKCTKRGTRRMRSTHKYVQTMLDMAAVPNYYTLSR